MALQFPGIYSDATLIPFDKSETIVGDPGSNPPPAVGEEKFVFQKIYKIRMGVGSKRTSSKLQHTFRHADEHSEELCCHAIDTCCVRVGHILRKKYVGRRRRKRKIRNLHTATTTINGAHRQRPLPPPPPSKKKERTKRMQVYARNHSC